MGTGLGMRMEGTGWGWRRGTWWEEVARDGGGQGLGDHGESKGHVSPRGDRDRRCQAWVGGAPGRDGVTETSHSFEGGDMGTPRPRGDREGQEVAGMCHPRVMGQEVTGDTG